MAYLRSVNVGLPKVKDWAGIGRTSIDKRAANGPVVLELLGLAGDQVSDTAHHGGLDQAVSAYAREDIDFWEAELGRTIRDGQFGENLTTEGIDLNEAEVGSRWRIGSAELEIALTRTPCNDFKGWMGESGYDNTAWVKRFAAAQRPGPYLRVLTPGTVTAGDEIHVIHRPGHGVTVRTMFLALTVRHDLLPELLRVPGLADKARRRAEEHAARMGSATGA
jgi:MOSC domain-containing protein YiiM